jgi:hypothetical protein
MAWCLVKHRETVPLHILIQSQRFRFSSLYFLERVVFGKWGNTTRESFCYVIITVSVGTRPPSSQKYIVEICDINFELDPPYHCPRHVSRKDL